VIKLKNDDNNFVTIDNHDVFLYGKEEKNHHKMEKSLLIIQNTSNMNTFVASHFIFLSL